MRSLVEREDPLLDGRPGPIPNARASLTTTLRVVPLSLAGEETPFTSRRPDRHAGLQEINGGVWGYSGNSNPARLVMAGRGWPNRSPVLRLSRQARERSISMWSSADTKST